MSDVAGAPARERFPGSAVWDDRRNTSRVQKVPPHALPEALDALARFRRAHPAHAAWIAEGAPTLTDDEHVRRFGEPYKTTRARRS